RAAAGTQTRGRDRATMATGVNSLDWHGSVMLPVSLQGFTPPWSIRRNPLPALSLKAGRSLTEQGALHCRAGRPREALPFLEQGLRADPRYGRTVLNWLWLALAHERLGKPEEARRWLGKAQAWLDR